MPSRFVSVAILIYWSVAAFCLLTWEILPELSLGYPPDLRSIAKAGDSSRPVTWDIQVVDDPKSPESGRSIGEAVTQSRRLEDGWFELTSRVVFDAAGIVKGTPLGSRGIAGARLELSSIYRVDPSGNLRSFDMKVRPRNSSEELFTVTGRLREGAIEVIAKGPIPILNQKLSFPYEPRSVVQGALGPLDRLPGLHLGQRWDTRVVNPFTGQVERVRVEVQRRALIHWNGEPVSVFEVVQHAGPIATKTWVRPDGVILRQEVPIPLVRLMLERRPDPSQRPEPKEPGRD
jgi:hypothetical protein